eukprot:Blabericola_migrator_1__3073@NODE_1898_length_3592_cov_148_977872_g1215_i0_p1_GENE_NODE_1898_length_3592_cov_148_977872_g1215_i0NODE_1898_length_3592_cov_148_977872_g1215_i0_p1_ORF_typecomplete_len535_score82_11Redoxin/PF08534_10/1e10_NODE_1898_length_3592_cov_148_977872_g1215_i017913395
MKKLGKRLEGRVGPLAMLRAGDLFPSTCIGLKSRGYDLRDRFEETAGVLIGSIGAFHPLDTQQLVPGYKNAASELHELGIDFIGCVAVNDPYVLRAWARRMKITNEISFISDVDASLSRTLGMDQIMAVEGYGSTLPRNRRFAILVGKGARILKVALGDDALSERFVPKVKELIKRGERIDITLKSPTPRRGSVASSKSSEYILNTTRTITTATSPVHTAPEVTEPADTWYPGRWLVPYPMTFGDHCVQDIEVAGITFNYSSSALCDSYMLRRDGGKLELSPEGDDDFGTVTIDRMRPLRAMRRLDRMKNGASQYDEQLPQMDTSYRIIKVVVTSEYGMMVENPVLNMDQQRPTAPHHYGIVTTAAVVIIIHELMGDETDEVTVSDGSEEEDVVKAPKYVVVVFGLSPGGRDCLLSNIQYLSPLEDQEERRVSRDLLPPESKDQGLGIAHLVAPMDRFYSFVGPCPLLTGDDGTPVQARWFLASEKAYASEKQLKILKSLRQGTHAIPGCAVALPPMARDARPDPIFFSICDCH